MPRKKSGFKSITKLILWSAVVFIFSVVAVFAYFAKDLPNPEKLSTYKPSQSTKIFDRTGEILLYDVHGEEKRTIIPLSDISQHLINATIVAEDDEFYNHFGIDIKSIIRAVIHDVLVWTKIKKGERVSIQGGSTITQQVIKNTLLSRERTIQRKIKEWILAIELEILHPKDKIIEIYLNQVPYGSNAYGAEAASQGYFKKSAKDLSLAEAALLASLPKAPTYYSPYGSHPEKLKTRQQYILKRMHDLNYISGIEYEEAINAELTLAENFISIFKAPHFVMFVKEYLEEKYGREFVENGGLKVYTTLDFDLQEEAQSIIEKKAILNQKRFGAFNAALTAIDPKTGQILAMVGSKDYFSESYPKGCSSGRDCLFDPNVNVAIRDRQPGSSFKPFVYAKAFEKGFTPETIIFDLKTEFNPFCDESANEEEDLYGLKCYHPENYDGKFRGPVSFRQALAQSLNVPSVKVLYLAGIQESIELAKKFGITTLSEPQNYGLALVLGGGEVKLLDQTAAFAVFANDGVKTPLSSILKIEDNEGKILEEFEEKSKRVINASIARKINNILSDNISRAPMFGERSALYFEDREVAAKTGTTQEYRDAWTIGYTPSIVTGVWVGNNDNTNMVKAPGASAAAPIWHEFMLKAFDKTPAEEFPKAETEDPVQKIMLNGNFERKYKVKIDKISGKLATDLTPEKLVEEKEFREIHNILHYLDKNNPLGEEPKNHQNDSQYQNWESSVWQWINSSLSGLNPFLYNKEPPREYDDIHTENKRPTVKILSPIDGETFQEGQSVILQFQSRSSFGLKKIEYFFDDNFINEYFPQETDSEWFIYSFYPPKSEEKSHLITVVVYDKLENRKEDMVEVIIE